MTTVLINRPGLTWNAVIVHPETTIVPATEMIGSYEYAGVRVDGQFVALVRTAHIAANPALADAVAALQTPPPAFTRKIRYDPTTRDFALYLDGQLVGFARSYHDGERTLDALVYEILSEERIAQADAQAERDAEAESLLGELNAVTTAQDRHEVSLNDGEDARAILAGRLHALGYAAVRPGGAGPWQLAPREAREARVARAAAWMERQAALRATAIRCGLPVSQDEAA